MKIPFVMHDCDAKPGLVTRKLAPFASGVSLAFGAAKGFIKNNNVRVNGNPLRAEFKTLTKEQARHNLGLENKLTVCIMGGSQGARSINEASVEILKTLSKDYNVQVIFQTGKKKFEELLVDLVYKPPGKPALVPDSGKRPAMNTAKNDFVEDFDNE